MKLAAAVIFATALVASSAASSSTPFAPKSDPGVYPGGDINPPDGWKTLPTIDGARIDNTTLVVGSGSGTLVHYIDAEYDAGKIKRAVIQIHGENRDAWNQWIYSDLAAKRAATGGSFDRDEVVVMAPMFFNTGDEGAYPFDPNLDSGNAVTSTLDTATVTAGRRSFTHHTQGAPVASPVPAFERRSRVEHRGVHRIPLQKWSTTQAMIWKSIEWGDGSPAYEPADSAGAGSFEALDSAVSFFLDRTRFPNLRKVVIAGFSLGAQLTNRYATFRDDTSQDDRLIFWISSPNSFVYLQDTRPLQIGTSCTETYGNYKYGLNGTLPNYYTRATSRVSTSSLITRYLSRTIFYLVGMDDLSAGLSSCAPNTQGYGHLDKMYYWTQQVVPMLPGSTGVEGELPGDGLVRYVAKTGHQDWKIITSDPGVETLWLKGWYENGTDAETPQSGGTVAAGTPSKSTIGNIHSANTAASGTRATVMALVLAAVGATMALLL
ncbi:hypothetical protein PSEUBRA_004327 [Kalmanozyma brasiliensis GHG001]|uniref:Uncharacterized protein n=1 Tax=Kalmanozyma brasiliensis (strain GHG001) TaxID=1365824 RepID=V5ETN0_KALBG|nr:uncharacterized protein PSEUBRA_004327 [Kalmanozyma brasiliensis GHG001]EST06428.1 hypothetical protein PSEUBRA_004327 [Kalmanozyma brasiliensis GHG001]